MIFDCLTKSQREKHETFPRKDKCAGCGNEFLRKSGAHKHCSEACRWKKAIRMNTDAAKRARARSAIWYRNNAEKHKANVAKRKADRCRQQVDSLSHHTLSSDTESESTVESATSEHSVRSSSPPSELTTSKTATADNTGEDQSQ